MEPRVARQEIKPGEGHRRVAPLEDAASPVEHPGTDELNRVEHRNRSAQPPAAALFGKRVEPWGEQAEDKVGGDEPIGVEAEPLPDGRPQGRERASLDPSRHHEEQDEKKRILEYQGCEAFRFCADTEPPGDQYEKIDGVYGSLLKENARGRGQGICLEVFRFVSA